MATPFSAFPPPPPPQNGLAATDFGPGAMFAAGVQGTAEVAVGASVAGGSGSSNSINSINVSKQHMCVYKAQRFGVRRTQSAVQRGISICNQVIRQNIKIIIQN